jgi:hypothetical protein
MAAALVAVGASAVALAAPMPHEQQQRGSVSHFVNVQQADYYWNHHQYHHRDWDRHHHRWHYYD